ncbi:peptidoglycan-binding protein [Agarivorans sp. 1_MG-2023]|uniref:peptidoglycan-binding domain-containing protein n=1 Tax=Agarivorans sp. 1_MG-2023 TaxID=3062634 RepID=UPI0026E1F59C|nr:hypothetical protein [Agarivorans sp. 1_MG-2023]MDO6765763.1 hypothetical protein [Agarivorans sp. 1_MG-2023]
MQLKQSVGRQGKNLYGDVLAVQKGLNTVPIKGPFKILAEDGKMGKNTQLMIEEFQRTIVKMINPDGRIDPNGRSSSIINSYAQKSATRHSFKYTPMPYLKAAKPTTRTQKASTTNSSKPKSILYRSNAKKVLSAYTMSVLKQIMQLSNVDSIDISSTLRTPEDQARIMLNDNLTASKNGISVKTHRGYSYGPTGQLVDKVYTDNKAGKTSEQIKALMVAKIKEKLATGSRTSRHCVTKAIYQSNNIFDIPYSSIASSKQAEFESILLAYSAKFNKRKFSKGNTTSYTAVQKPIEKVIVERSCWHVELPQTNLQLPTLP